MIRIRNTTPGGAAVFTTTAPEPPSMNSARYLEKKLESMGMVGPVYKSGSFQRGGGMRDVKPAGFSRDLNFFRPGKTEESKKLIKSGCCEVGRKGQAV